jgi:hypothetical protein
MLSHHDGKKIGLVDDPDLHLLVKPTVSYCEVENHEYWTDFFLESDDEGIRLPKNRRQVLLGVTKF